MAEIKKKCWPMIFEAVLSGKKNFDLRISDFPVSVGDILILEEWNPETKKYTGRKIEKKVKYVLKTKEKNMWLDEDIDKYGFVAMGLE